VPEKKLLIVDDESHILNVLALKLKNAGYDIFTASSGEEALEKFDDVDPDMLVTDFSMPGINGAELVKAIRSKEKGKDLPVIMLTARGQNVEEDNEYQLNLSALISKPFSPRDVLGHIRNFLTE